MNPTALALAAYILLFMLVLISIPSLRGIYMLTKGKAINDFKPDGSDLDPFMQRLCRVHANYYECFPVVGGLLLLSLAADQTQITDPLALVLIGARACQTAIHLMSTSKIAVWLRFSFFLVQILIGLSWIVGLIRVFMGGA